MVSAAAAAALQQLLKTIHLLQLLLLPAVTLMPSALGNQQVKWVVAAQCLAWEVTGDGRLLRRHLANQQIHNVVLHHSIIQRTLLQAASHLQQHCPIQQQQLQGHHHSHRQQRQSAALAALQVHLVASVRVQPGPFPSVQQHRGNS